LEQQEWGLFSKKTLIFRNLLISSQIGMNHDLNNTRNWQHDSWDRKAPSLVKDEELMIFCVFSSNQSLKHGDFSPIFGIHPS